MGDGIGRGAAGGGRRADRKPVKVYNLLFPIWLLIWFPLFWLVLVPANYGIDWLVLSWSLKGYGERKEFCQRTAWKICTAGFAADFAGSAFLFLVMALGGPDTPEWFQEVGAALNMNPFQSAASVLFTAAGVAISAVLIYVIDRILLQKEGLSRERAKKSALFLALFTAPYLFFIPSRLLYI